MFFAENATSFKQWSNAGITWKHFINIRYLPTPPSHFATISCGFYQIFSRLIISFANTCTFWITGFLALDAHSSLMQAKYWLKYHEMIIMITLKNQSNPQFAQFPNWILPSPCENVLFFISNCFCVLECVFLVFYVFCFPNFFASCFWV